MKPLTEFALVGNQILESYKTGALGQLSGVSERHITQQDILRVTLLYVIEIHLCKANKLICHLV